MGESEGGPLTGVFPGHQGGAGTTGHLSSQPPRPGSTEGADDWSPPHFSGMSFPEFLFATFDMWLGVPWVKNCRDDALKMHLVKQQF